MLRYIDTFARYIWIWLIPIILFPVAASLFLLSNASYTATGSLWVDQALFSDQQSGVQGSSWQSPSQQMAGLFTELMSTRDFVNGVIDSTSYRNSVKTDADRIEVLQTITAKTKISGDNFRLISISYTANKYDTAIETLDAIMTRFRAYYDERISQQGDGALAYYQKLVSSTKQDLDTATAAVRAFLDEHPNQIGQNISNGGATTPIDLEYANLNQNLTVARTRYDEANANLEKVVTNYNAYKQGQSTTLRVQDKPAILGNGNSRLAQIGLGTAIGLAISAILVLASTILITLLDGTIRASFYARQLLSDEFLLELPQYKVVKPKALKKGQQVESQPMIKEGVTSRRQRKKSISQRTLLQSLINQLKDTSGNRSAAL